MPSHPCFSFAILESSGASNSAVIPPRARARKTQVCVVGHRDPAIAAAAQSYVYDHRPHRLLGGAVRRPFRAHTTHRSLPPVGWWEPDMGTLWAQRRSTATQRSGDRRANQEVVAATNPSCIQHCRQVDLVPAARTQSWADRSVIRTADQKACSASFADACGCDGATRMRRQRGAGRVFDDGRQTIGRR